MSQSNKIGAPDESTLNSPSTKKVINGYQIFLFTTATLLGVGSGSMFLDDYFTVHSTFSDTLCVFFGRFRSHRLPNEDVPKWYRFPKP